MFNLYHPTDFFQNSRDFVISGGSFTIIGDSRVDLSTLHAHTQATIHEHRKTRQYIIFSVLFGRPRMDGCKLVQCEVASAVLSLSLNDMLLLLNYIGIRG